MRVLSAISIAATLAVAKCSDEYVTITETVDPNAPVATCAPFADVTPAPGDYLYYQSEAISQLDNVANMLHAWNAGQGIFGALKIQRGYYAMSSAIDNLNYVGRDFSFDRSEAPYFAKRSGMVISSTIKLLEAMTDRANDLKSIGGAQIIANDIRGMAGPASLALQDALDRLPSDVPCPVVDEYRDQAFSLSSKFSSAGAVFNVAGPNFPTVTNACLPYCTA